ncbi:MAG: DEAD/DEAH box helicase [Tissierellia bacterium]|nr:DEAD/DEAH box helicase [Tissierellia bacterium]
MTISFNDFNISKEIIDAIGEMGFEEPSPIQAGAIPLVLQGIDVIGQAQTGTGKTAAFGIPILERIDSKSKNVQAMILCPTRELSIQVAEEISKLGKFLKGVKVVPIYGGQPIERQIRALKQGTQIVVGTPGRIIDHIKRKTLKTDNIKIFVLDEADEMFDMGFREDIEMIIGRLPEEKQMTFFSATMAKEIMNFAKTYQSEPEIIRVVKKEMTVPKVDQYYFDLDPHMKTEILARVLDIYNPNLTIVFCNTKRMVDELTSKLKDRGYLAEALHGDLKQNQRDFVMNKFRKLSTDILVATDVAARGIDVDEVDMVVNYDMPQDDEYYVHRIGRTARAGREGTAISFVSGKEYYKLRDIQKYTKSIIARKEIPTLGDIRKNESTKLLNILTENINKEENKKYEPIINVLLEENYNPIDIASVCISLYMNEKGVGNHEELDYIDNDKKRPVRKQRQARPKERFKKGKWKRVFINIGRIDGVSERHILSAILQNNKLHKNDVGSIDIYDKYSFVDINAKRTNEVVKDLNKIRIRGRKIKSEIAKSSSKSGRRK